MKVRAKFRIGSVTKYQEGIGDVTLTAVTADGVPENERYHRYTPSGELKMRVDNPPVLAAFEGRLGKTVYVDFADAE